MTEKKNHENTQEKQDVLEQYVAQTAQNDFLGSSLDR